MENFYFIDVLILNGEALKYSDAAENLDQVIVKGALEHPKFNGVYDYSYQFNGRPIYTKSGGDHYISNIGNVWQIHTLGTTNVIFGYATTNFDISGVKWSVFNGSWSDASASFNVTRIGGGDELGFFKVLGESPQVKRDGVVIKSGNMFDSDSHTYWESVPINGGGVQIYFKETFNLHLLEIVTRIDCCRDRSGH